MIKAAYNLFIHDPIYNLLVFLIEKVPFADLGIAIIILTLIVKFILFPLSMKAVKSQMDMKRIQPEVNTIREKHKEDKQAQAMELMELYKREKVKPFSGILVLLLQFPVLIAIYSIILRGGFPTVSVDILYSFVQAPETVNMMFLGLVNMAGKSIPLAALTSVSQYIQLKLAIPEKREEKKKNKKKNKKNAAPGPEQIAENMQKQMKYVMPLFIGVLAYIFSAAVALYLITSNIFHILQELYVRKRYKEKHGEIDGS